MNAKELLAMLADRIEVHYDPDDNPHYRFMAGSENIVQQCVDDAIALVDARWKERLDAQFAETVKQRQEVERLRQAIEKASCYCGNDRSFSYLSSLLREALGEQAEKPQDTKGR